MKTTALILTAAGLTAVLPSCARVAVEPIEVKPIHITMDVNIRVERELDQFFDFEDKLLTGEGAAAPAQSSKPSPDRKASPAPDGRETELETETSEGTTAERLTR